MDIVEGVIEFDWNNGNEEKNWKKHGISSKEAEQPFYDDKKLILNDIKHSEKEKRFILMGNNNAGEVLFIVFTFRMKRIRIISARKADRKEVDYYKKAINIT